MSDMEPARHDCGRVDAVASYAPCIGRGCRVPLGIGGELNSPGRGVLSPLPRLSGSESAGPSFADSTSQRSTLASSMSRIY
jgi:hypothetical protein